MDFAFCIPALIATGMALLRHRPLAVKATYALAPFATLLSASVAVMAVAMELKHDPSIGPIMLGVVLGATGILSMLTFRLLHVCLSPQANDERLSEGKAPIMISSKNVDRAA